VKKYLLSLLFISLFLGCHQSKNAVKKENNTSKPAPQKPTSPEPVTPKPTIPKKPHAIIEAKEILFLGETLQLNATKSYDEDGKILSYLWRDDNNQLFSTQKMTTWKPTDGIGYHTLSLTVIDDSNLSQTKKKTIHVKAKTNADLLDEVKTIITSGKATYICVGDSTRVKPKYPGQRPDSTLLFETVQSKLATYQVHSFLRARSGHKLEEFINSNGTIHPTYHDILYIIDNNTTSPDGKDTIVDISLAINDYLALKQSDKANIAQQLKNRLLKAISLIKSKKPQTTFLLSSPNPIKGDKNMEIYMDVYQEVATQLALPFINFYDDVFVGLSNTEQKALYEGSGDYTHYGSKGLKMMAEYILSKITPQ
jgi:hypothetical protein